MAPETGNILLHCQNCGKAFIGYKYHTRKFCTHTCYTDFIHKQTLMKIKRMKETGKKKCSKCGKSLPVNSFHKNKNKSDGLHAICRKCVSKQRKDYCSSEKGFRVYKDNMLIKTYGITLVQYEALLENQGGVCIICGEKEIEHHQNGKLRQLSVDHDHETGVVRGLLCNKCNRGLGFFKENPLLLLEAANYLEKYNKKNKIFKYFQ